MCRGTVPPPSGHPYAQMMLGRYLARNLAGEQNIEQARRWTERAVAQGLQEAKADLAALPPAPEPNGVQSAEEKSAHAAGY
jgi:TPR repeat protein